MAHILGNGSPQEALSKAVVPSRVMAAVTPGGTGTFGSLLGLAAVDDGSGPPLHLVHDDFVRAFGPVRGRWRALLTGFLMSKPHEGELELNFLCVASSARSTRVGGALLAAVEERARDAGLAKVCLEVVDNNPRARALYERYGYRHLRRVHVPFLRPIMGFGAYDEMELEVRSRHSD